MSGAGVGGGTASTSQSTATASGPSGPSAPPLAAEVSPPKLGKSGAGAGAAAAPTAASGALIRSRSRAAALRASSCDSAAASRSRRSRPSRLASSTDISPPSARAVDAAEAAVAVVAREEAREEAALRPLRSLRLHLLALEEAVLRPLRRLALEEASDRAGEVGRDRAAPPRRLTVTHPVPSSPARAVGVSAPCARFLSMVLSICPVRLRECISWLETQLRTVAITATDPQRISWGFVAGLRTCLRLLAHGGALSPGSRAKARVSYKLSPRLERKDRHAARRRARRRSSVRSPCRRPHRDPQTRSRRSPTSQCSGPGHSTLSSTFRARTGRDGRLPCSNVLRAHLAVALEAIFCLVAPLTPRRVAVLTKLGHQSTRAEAGCGRRAEGEHAAKSTWRARTFRA